MPDAGALRAWVHPAIHDRHPDYTATVVIAIGLRNGPTDADGDRRLTAAEMACVRAG